MEGQGFLILVRRILVELFQTLDMEVVWVCWSRFRGEQNELILYRQGKQGFVIKC